MSTSARYVQHLQLFKIHCLRLAPVVTSSCISAHQQTKRALWQQTRRCFSRICQMNLCCSSSCSELLLHKVANIAASSVKSCRQGSQRRGTALAYVTQTQITGTSTSRQLVKSTLNNPLKSFRDMLTLTFSGAANSIKSLNKARCESGVCMH